ncbi:MAG: tetratricopeptide repeat protein [Lentimonas sp.]
MEVPLLQHPIAQRLRRILTTLAVLLLLGLLLRPVEAPAWEVVKTGQAELNLEAIEGALGQGLVVGVLGGFRTIMADFTWIRMNTIWQRRDRAKLDAMIRLVTTLDPRPEFFWVNSSRMVAYDVPNWRIKEEGGYDAVSKERQRELDFEQAQQAFKLLERAREFHPDNPKLVLETGQIHLNRLKDIPNAAKWFLKAAEMPGAPYFAARIHAELLRQQGKDQEAYAYLKNLHQTLPNQPRAQKGIVLERIRTLEEDLKIPYLLRFKVVGITPVVNPSQPTYRFDQPEPHDHSHEGHSH